LAVLLLSCGWMLAQADNSSTSNSTNSNSTSTQSSQTDQNANPSATPSTSDQNANTQATPSTSDQSTAAQSNTDQNAASDTGATKSGKKLPQTASPLPLLSLLGLGSFASAFALRKRK
jgi:LPXTG-motif cell wall-anchored protein